MAIVPPLDEDITTWLRSAAGQQFATHYEAMRDKVVELDGAGGASGGLLAHTRQIAATALGVDPNTLAGDFYPIGVSGSTGRNMVAAGGGTLPGGGAVTRLRLQTSATANSLVVIRATANSAGEPRIIPTGAAKKWWIGGVWNRGDAVALAAGDSAGLLISAATGGNVGFIGMRQDGSGTNFVAALSNGAFSYINSGVAFDTQRRFHEFWRDGTTGNYRLNLATNLYGSLGSPVQGNIQLANDATFGIVIQNGAGGTNYVCDYEWVAAWAVQE
jgi:hypothetical protein